MLFKSFLCFIALAIVAVAENPKTTKFKACCRKNGIKEYKLQKICDYDHAIERAKKEAGITNRSPVDNALFQGLVLGLGQGSDNQPLTHPIPDRANRKISDAMKKVHLILRCMADYKNHTQCCEKKGIPQECVKSCDLSESTDWYTSPERKVCAKVWKKRNVVDTYECYRDGSYND
ncbi:DB module domain-containing protein [Ditylenchus destructor]|nr:DB module domain-containing protein [Ditylenchus destructor]